MYLFVNERNGPSFPHGKELSSITISQRDMSNNTFPSKWYGLFKYPKEMKVSSPRV